MCLQTICLLQRGVFGELFQLPEIQEREPISSLSESLLANRILRRAYSWADWFSLHGERFLGEFTSCRKVQVEKCKLQFVKYILDEINEKALMAKSIL